MDKIRDRDRQLEAPDPPSAALFVQEHHKQGDNWLAWKEKAGRRKWMALGAPATSGIGGGNSAGVALLSPRGKNFMGTLPFLSTDLSPQNGSGRITTGFLDVGPGILGISAYFWTGLPLTDHANTQILNKITAAIDRFGGAWILQGDFQNTPADLDSTGWPQAVGGYIIAPDAPTCKNRTIVFWVIDSRLAKGSSGASR